jgi:geranylgeranyl transferase type-2 subunit beta
MWLKYALLAGGGSFAWAPVLQCARIEDKSGGKVPSAPDADDKLKQETRDFIVRCQREDGGYAASPDPTYEGNSDTKLSDLAGVTYAVVLARTMNWTLPNRERSIAFIRRHQQADGRFVNLGGQQDPKSDLAELYNTTQGVVALHALDEKPSIDPSPAMVRFFKDDTFKKLPWYTTSFYPLFYAALGKPFPKEFAQALAQHQEQNQASDGYLDNHVAATFHMAHFFRLIGKPTPKQGPMVERVLRNQKPDGGWNIKQPDWDVHACFDAVFILRQLGGDTERVRMALRKAAEWALSCRNADGGFGHFPNWHSDMDAVYFQFGALLQTGRVSAGLPAKDLRIAHTLGWGHAMEPNEDYVGKAND